MILQPNERSSHPDTHPHVMLVGNDCGSTPRLYCFHRAEAAKLLADIDAVTGRPITRDSFLAALAASEEGEDMTGAEMCAEWDMLHENAELCYARGDMRDIDEDP